MASAKERDGIGRSVGLFKAFRLEQTKPEVFYSTLADDTIRMINRHQPVRGSLVLDIGAGRPQFADAFVDAGARYVGLDPDVSMLEFATTPVCSAVAGDGLALPFKDGQADIVLSSNVFEHVPDIASFGAEIIRVTRPGGIAVVSYTNWLSPWGGHEMSPYHYLGADRAAARYERKNGHRGKHKVDENLFRVSVADGLRWARSLPDAELIDSRPRYYPSWVSWLTDVPGLREVASWNLWMVLRKSR